MRYCVLYIVISIIELCPVPPVNICIVTGNYNVSVAFSISIACSRIDH